MTCGFAAWPGNWKVKTRLLCTARSTRPINSGKGYPIFMPLRTIVLQRRFDCLMVPVKAMNATLFRSCISDQWQRPAGSANKWRVQGDVTMHGTKGRCIITEGDQQVPIATWKNYWWLPNYEAHRPMEWTDWHTNCKRSYWPPPLQCHGKPKQCILSAADIHVVMFVGLLTDETSNSLTIRS